MAHIPNKKYFKPHPDGYQPKKPQKVFPEHKANKHHRTHQLACIDPDTRIAGISIFQYNYYDMTVSLLYSTSCRMKIRTSFDISSCMISHQIAQLLLNFNVHKVLIEYPRFLSSPKGIAAANSGALVKLAFAVGTTFQAIVAAYTFEDRRVPEISLVNPSKWKGNVPKKITKRRIERHWGVAPDDNNEADAIGIGDWYFRKTNLALPDHILWARKKTNRRLTLEIIQTGMKYTRSGFRTHDYETDDAKKDYRKFRMPLFDEIPVL